MQQALAAQPPTGNGYSTTDANGQAPGVKAAAPQGYGTAAANGTAPICPVHQVVMEQRSNARGSWWSHWLVSEQRYCKGKN